MATTPTLDDTLLAVVRVTHEHGLPLTGADVHAGRVQVYVDGADLPWWVRWLTDPIARSRVTVWMAVGDDRVALHASGWREDIEWALAEHIPAATAGPALAEHGVTVSDVHLPLPTSVVLALVDAHATASGGGERS